MQLSTKGRYAVMAMVDLAGQSGGGRGVSLAEIAARQDISLAYLEQLFAKLRRSGLVQSARGPGGGYRLTLPAAETRIADIVTAVDEPLEVTRCGGQKSGDQPGCMPNGARCATHALWEALGRQIHGFLSGVSLADVLNGRLGAAGLEAAA
jgi:Rrf2 family iron-sulfur cluster assembly transcriptional regulator